jgi:hypothetical protein
MSPSLPTTLKEMARCASSQLKAFAAYRFRLFCGVFPGLSVCPLFEAERAIGDGWALVARSKERRRVNQRREAGEERTVVLVPRSRVRQAACVRAASYARSSKRPSGASSLRSLRRLTTSAQRRSRAAAVSALSDSSSRWRR